MSARHISLGQMLAQCAEQGLYRLTTVTIQMPGPRNGWQAIIWCEVRLYKDAQITEYAGFGDANPDDTPVSCGDPARLAALLARAEYRAKRAALTHALNLPDSLNPDPSGLDSTPIVEASAIHPENQP